MPERVICINGQELSLARHPKKEKIDSDFFWPSIRMMKRYCCEVCLGEMQKGENRWKQATSGPIAGWDITPYTCKVCGHTHEEARARD